MVGYVVDTNVCVVANNRDCPQADTTCVQSCVVKLRECVDILKGRQTGVVVIDDRQEILNEYRLHLDFKGQPGVGDMFFKELFNRQATPVCEKVKITPDSRKGYIEFPDDAELAKFDPSDRKFVAVAIASKHSPVILNAVDSDWSEYQTVLSRYVTVKELCPHCIKVAKHRRKRGAR